MNASAGTRTSANRPQTFVNGLSRRPALGFLDKLAAWFLQTRAPDTDGGIYALVRQRRRASSHGAPWTLRTCGDRCGFGPGLSGLGTAFHRRLAVTADLDTGTSEGRLAADALISVGELEHARKAQHTGEAGAQARAKRSAISRPAVRNLSALKKHIVAMRSAGMTLQAIADRLNSEGVPTLRGGKKWRPWSVQVAAGYRRPGQASRAGSLPKGGVRTGRVGGMD
jgi:hypothetical protein